jgi:protein TonB
LHLSRLVPAGVFSERFRTEAGRRAIGIFAALLLEAVLLLLLLSLSLNRSKPPPEERSTLVSFTVNPEPAPEPAASPEPKARRDERPVSNTPDPPQPQTPAPQAVTMAPPISPPVVPVPPPPAAPATARPAQAVIRGQQYGPPDAGSRSSDDSERVGTAPNGEPLYAARWYRKPYDDELRGYLSTATGPGWGLIACRTAPDYRVEDCVGLEEHPLGSMINRAILAAAWQFKVRPPRLGGRSLVGEWVRIRIDYDITPQPARAGSR